MVCIRDGNAASLPLLLSAFLAVSACGRGPAAKPSSAPNLLSQVPVGAWERLGQMRILFGHQSVGFNILDGMKDVMRENPAIKLNIVEIKAPSLFAGPSLAHFRVGKNFEPDLKTDDFARYLDEWAGDAPDIAFFKFCYVDATADADVRKIFTHYKQTLADLRPRHLQTAFIHVTMPLATIQTGWKVPIKMLLGRPIYGCAEDAKRSEFNDLVRAEYASEEPIFDLAAIESTSPDGSRMTFSYGGRTCYAMVPAYAADEGHPNEVGRRIIAERLLVLLATLAGQRQ